MEKIEDAQDLEPLIRALRDDDGLVRWEAAWALGEVGDARAVEPLIEALRDENSSVREEVARALGKIRTVSASSVEWPVAWSQ